MNIPIESFRLAIIEDSPQARENIEAHLRDDPEVQVVAQCTNGPRATEMLLQHRPDILMLDATRSGLDALEFLTSVPVPLRPKVIFVAAHDRFAVRAFDVHAVDYLVTPFSRGRFAEALIRAKVAVRRAALQGIFHRLDQILRVLRPVPVPAVAKVREEKGRVFLRSGGEIHLVDSGEIRWIETDGDYVRVHTTGKAHLVRMPLSKLMEKLDPAQFVRIHRSAAINLQHLSRATPARSGEYTVNLANGTTLKVSRTFVQSLKIRL